MMSEVTTSEIIVHSSIGRTQVGRRAIEAKVAPGETIAPGIRATAPTSRVCPPASAGMTASAILVRLHFHPGHGRGRRRRNPFDVDVFPGKDVRDRQMVRRDRFAISSKGLQL